MRNIKIDKLVIHCRVGESGDRLTKAAKVLEQISGQTPVFSKAKVTIRQFGIRRNERISARVTIRGAKARDILEKALAVKEYSLKEQNFSDTGNFGFGIDEHIDLAGSKYDPSIGIFGMDFFVVTTRPGQRVAVRKRRQNRMGLSQRVTRKDSIEWTKSEFDLEVRTDE
ncbi:ribosomal protein L5 [Kipferlia bialata]|uniref:Ribosomal protein L5 n=1 Tax=Kipferlia bialata TaxID=797122 RepID=A0A391P0Q1_9EUKA|nr:ribosomal protein L5 [Kipferlia bialata]|eukprot:g2286.t1